MLRVLGVAALVAVVVACGGSKAAEPGVTIRINTPVAAVNTPDEGDSDTTLGSDDPIAPPELVLSDTSVVQGGALLVSVVGRVSGGSVELFGSEHTLIQGEHSMFTFIGVDTERSPGPYTMRVGFVLENGSSGTLPVEITVLETQWTVDSLSFTENDDRFLDAHTVSDEESQLREVYSIDSPEKLWDGPWLLPIDGPLTASFGEQRSINGGPPSGHHSGTDLGAPMGTPVGATNHGVVVMARQLARRGNYVVIDHGGGVLSGYGHLSQFSVAEGQVVAPGDTIGLVGSTGLSTGAHLHWEMSVDGVLVDALRFFNGSNGF